MRLMSNGKGPAQRRPQRAAVDRDGSLLLDLEDGDERLPWLEGEEDDEDTGVDTHRVAVFALALLLFFVMLAIACWWLWQGRHGADIVADGSVIEAPEGPYKVRPDNSGGRQVLGTGGTSFAVAEGKRVEGRIASEPVRAPPAEAIEGQPAAAATPVTSGVGVQIGAYPSKEAAQAGWTQLHTRLPPLSGRSYRILEGAADSGTVYRLQVVAESAPAARELCLALRQAGGDCQVKR